MTAQSKLNAHEKLTKSLGAYEAEQKKARTRILEFSDGPIGWFLNFISVNLDIVGTGGWQDIRQEISAFAYYGHYFITSPDSVQIFLGSQTRYERGWEKSEDADQPDWSKLSTEEIFERKALPWPKTVCRLQTWCKESIETYIHNKHVSLPQPPAKVNITPTKIWMTANRGEDAFIGHFIELLKSQKSHLKQCIECQIFFLAGRTDQRFHTIRCQSRHNMRIYRNAPHEQPSKANHKRQKRTPGPPRNKRKHKPSSKK